LSDGFFIVSQIAAAERLALSCSADQEESTMSFINEMGRMIRHWVSLGGKGRRAQGRSSRARNGCRPHQRRPWFEELESRLVPTVTVFIDPSTLVLTAQCDGGANVVTVDHAGSSAVVNGQSFLDTNYVSIRVNGGAGGTTANFHANVKPLTFFGGSNLFISTDTVNVGEGGSVQNIAGALTIEDPPAYANVNVDDQHDDGNRTVTIDNFTPVGDTEFGRIVGLAPAAIDFECNDTGSVLVNTGSSAVTVNVLSTFQIRNALTLSGHSLNTTVNVGSNGSVQGILGTVNIDSAPSSYTALRVNDSADILSRSPTLSESSLTGLAPATINYQQSGLRSLDLYLGNSTWGNQLSVSNTPVSAVPGGMMTTINTGTASKGGDVLFVQRTIGALTVNLNNDFVHPVPGVLLGYPLATLDYILTPVTVNGSGGYTDLALFDGATTVGQLYTVTDTTITRGTQLMATYHQINNALFLYGSSGANTINVQSKSTNTVIDAGWSNDTINIGSTANTLNSISDNGSGYLGIVINTPGSQVILNDQGTLTDPNLASHTYHFAQFNGENVISLRPNLGDGGVFFLGPLQSVIFNGSGGSDTYAIETTFTDTTIYGGAGGNTFQISPGAQKLENVVGALTLHGGGNDTLDFYDTNNTNNEMYTFDPNPPSSLTLASDPNFSVNWTGIGVVNLYTNGHSSWDDPSGTVNVFP
jgi:hypothetical protein